MPFLTGVLVVLSAILAPLSSELGEIALFGKCAADESRGCVPFFMAVPQVIRTLEGVVGLIILLVIVLMVVMVLGGWDVGLAADPRSILGLAALGHEKGVREVFARLNRDVTVGTVDLKEVRRRVGKMAVELGSFVADAGHTEFGVIVGSQGGVRDGHYHTGDGGKYQVVGSGQTGTEKPVKTGNIVATLLGFMGLLIGLGIIILYYRLREEDTPFERFMSSQGFGPRFLFALFGVLSSFIWAAIHRGVYVFLET